MTHRCDVCVELLNKSNHAQVSCPYCTFNSCSECTERYLLETTQDAHCMNCKKGWSREILLNNLTTKFVTRAYKQRRENLLFERETSLMPATQPYVENEKIIRKNFKTIMQLHKMNGAAIGEYHRCLATPLGPFAVEHGLATEFEASILLQKKAVQFKNNIDIIKNDINFYEWWNLQLRTRALGDKIESEKRKFVRACPSNGCKGFLSTSWKCGLCDIWVCSTCHDIKGMQKDTPHTCNADSVATAELLAKDSRTCPCCAAMIFKINGCSQMFCTQCHTAFDWRTGRIETGPVHNPHFFEFQRATGFIPRNPLDVLCGGMPDWHSIQPFVSKIVAAFVATAYRTHAHAMHILIPRYTVGVNDNRDLRISFMIGDSDEDEFKRKIQAREKSRQKKVDITQIIQMYLNVVVDLFQTFADNKKSDSLVHSLIGIKKAYNEALDLVSKRYSNCAVPKLTDTFYFPN